MAEGFRKDSGHGMYCAILAIIETLKKNMRLVENAKNIYGCTDYILAGAKTDCAAGRLNCYFL